MEQQVIEDVPEPNAEEEEDANSLCVGDVASEGEEAAPEPSKAEKGLCVGDVSSEEEEEAAPEPSKAEEVSGTAEHAKTSPALEGRVPQGKSNTPSRER